MYYICTCRYICYLTALRVYFHCLVWPSSKFKFSYFVSQPTFQQRSTCVAKSIAKQELTTFDANHQISLCSLLIRFVRQASTILYLVA